MGIGKCLLKLPPLIWPLYSTCPSLDLISHAPLVIVALVPSDEVPCALKVTKEPALGWLLQAISPLADPDVCTVACVVVCAAACIGRRFNSWGLIKRIADIAAKIHIFPRDMVFNKIYLGCDDIFMFLNIHCKTMRMLAV
jgi:hypothetical protein